MGEDEDVNDTPVFSLFLLFHYGYRVCPVFLCFYFLLLPAAVFSSAFFF